MLHVSSQLKIFAICKIECRMHGSRALPFHSTLLRYVEMQRIAKTEEISYRYD
jgi:hypothetical protein